MVKLVVDYIVDRGPQKWGLTRVCLLNLVKCRGALLLVLEVDWSKEGRRSPDWFV